MVFLISYILHFHFLRVFLGDGFYIFTDVFPQKRDESPLPPLRKRTITEYEDSDNEDNEVVETSVALPAYSVEFGCAKSEI